MVAGARFLHVVDSTGPARGAGQPGARAADHRGARGAGRAWRRGLRSIASIRRALAAGASRVVLGTAASPTRTCSTRPWAFTSRILVGVDVRGGMVSVAGWTRETQVRGEDAIRRMQQRGATRFVYTNVDRDGMLDGPDLDEVRRVSRRCEGASSTRAASARSTTCERSRRSGS